MRTFFEVYCEIKPIIIELFKAIPILAILIFLLSTLVTYFFLPPFLMWLDELLFGKSKVEIIQNKVKRAETETVNSELKNFTILYLKNPVGRFIIFKDVFYDDDPTKATLKFSTAMLNPVNFDQDFYSFVIKNTSSGIRKLKKPVIRFESTKRIFHEKNDIENIKEVNCGGYESGGFCTLKLEDLEPGKTSSFSISGNDIKMPQYTDSARVSTETKIITYESHIKLLVEDENIIGVGGLQIPLPKDVVGESSLYLLINNPAEWVPLNVLADKSSKSVECKIYKSAENNLQNESVGTWFDLVIINNMITDCKEITVNGDFGKYNVKEAYFKSGDLAKDKLYKVKPNQPTFYLVLDNVKAQTTQVIKILSEGDNFKSLKISSSSLKKDLFIDTLDAR